MIKPLHLWQIKAIDGQGSGSIRIRPTPRMRLHALLMTLTTSSQTLAALCTAMTEIRVLFGTIVIWRLNGTKLRDFVLLNGTTKDFNGGTATTHQVRLSFAPEWLFAAVANLMALNPVLFGAPISVEIDSSTNLTVSAWEEVSDDAGDVGSMGFLGLQVISPVLSGTSQFVTEPIKPVGKLLVCSIYPDGGGVVTTTASLYAGAKRRPIHEEVTSAINLDRLETRDFTPAASGRTADIYDIVGARADLLDEASDLRVEGEATLKLVSAGYGAAAAILLARLVRYNEAYSV